MMTPEFLEMRVRQEDPTGMKFSRLSSEQVASFFNRQDNPDFNGCGNPRCLCLDLKENGDCVNYLEPETLTAEEFAELYGEDEDDG